MNDLQTLQHLLRNLNNFPKLRQNALVIALRTRSGLAGHALHTRVRAIVTESLEATVQLHSIQHGVERAARWQTIIQRCDLNGEHHDIVASDLGVSRRRFYQERRAAQESLANALAQALDGAAQPPLAVPSEAELQIEIATALRMRGELELAARILEPIASAGFDTVFRLEAMTELAEVYDALGRSAELFALLDASRALAYDVTTANPAFEIEALIVEATLCRAQGMFDQHLATLERIHHRLTHGDIVGARRDELTLRTALALANLHHCVGNASGMQAYLASTGETLEHGAANRPEHRAEHLILAAESAVFRGDLRSAVQSQKQCLTLARVHGLSGYVFLASFNLSICHLQSRQYGVARRHGRNALVAAQLCLPPDHAVETTGLLSQIEIETGHPAEALGMVADARSRFNAGGGYHYQLTFASALERSGRAQDALNVLESISGDIRGRGWQRFLGAVERIRAEACVGLERGADARHAIDNAVQILERHGSSYQLARAYDSSSRITGDPLHRKRAREIHAQLTL
jgi:hypothetical protein